VDGGATLAFAFAALGCYSAAAAGEGIERAVLRALGASLFAIPLQLLALLVAGVLLGVGLPDPAEFWLRHGAWVVSSALGLAWLQCRPMTAQEQRRRRTEGSARIRSRG
jgi:hypothetical protein